MLLRFACPVAVLALSLFAADARADRILIAGGGKTPVDAQAALLSLVVPVALKLPASAPRIVKSDDIPGLNPGFHIVVVGQCKDDARANAALDVLRVFNPGAYAKDAKTSAPDTECPTVDAAAVDKRSAVTAQHAVRKGVDAVQWALIEVPSREKEAACRIPAVRVEVRRQRQVLASQEETPLCSAGSGDDLGTKTTPSASFADVGDHTFVVVSTTTWAGDHSSNNATAYAFCADGITELVALPSWMGAAMSSIEAVTPQPDPARPMFAVLEAGTEVSRHRFVPERCAVEPMPPTRKAPSE